MADQEKAISGTPTSEFRFFIFDHANGEFSFYRSTEDRNAASEAVINQYLDDGWDEDVEYVYAGEVTAMATKVDVIERPPENQIDEDGMDEDGRFWPGDVEYCCGYELRPLPAAPGDTAAPEQAEQPECGCCGRAGPCDPDCDCAGSPDVVKVPRELAERIETAHSQNDWATLHEAMGEFNARLGDDA